ncbi:hypothetical protein ABIA54_003918 [Pseudomonas sp. EB276 TE3739]|nr:hypothetical protein [Pseudomonas koreensis]
MLHRLRRVRPLFKPVIGAYSTALIAYTGRNLCVEKARWVDFLTALCPAIKLWM